MTTTQDDDPATTIESIEIAPTIAAHWDVFHKMVIPANAPDIQRTAMQQAFFSGAISVMKLMVAASDMEDDEAHAILSGLEAEATAWMVGALGRIADEIRAQVEASRQQPEAGNVH